MGLRDRSQAWAAAERDRVASSELAARQQAASLEIPLIPDWHAELVEELSKRRLVQLRVYQVDRKFAPYPTGGGRESWTARKTKQRVWVIRQSVWDETSFRVNHLAIDSNGIYATDIASDHSGKRIDGVTATQYSLGRRPSFAWDEPVVRLYAFITGQAAQSDTVVIGSLSEWSPTSGRHK